MWNLQGGRSRKTGAAVAAIAVSVVMLTGCSASADADSGASKPADSSTAPLHDQLPQRIQDAGEIIVANPLSNPPYAYRDTDGKTLLGNAPDLAKALEPILGVKFQWQDTPFPGLIPGLQSKKFDMIWGSITDTKEREKTLDFVNYAKDGAVLLVTAKNPKDISDIESLCGLTASALSGSIQVELLTEQSAQCTADGEEAVTVKEFGSVPDAQVAIRSGQADVFFAGMGAALYQVATAKNSSGDPEFARVGPVYKAQVYGAGFRKDDTELRDAIQAGIKQLVEDGTYDEIMDTYGMKDAAVGADEVTVNGGIS